MDLTCYTLYDRLSYNSWLYTVGHECRESGPVLIVYVKRKVTGLEELVPYKWNGYPVEIKMVPPIPTTPIGGFK